MNTPLWQAGRVKQVLLLHYQLDQQMIDSVLWSTWQMVEECTCSSYSLKLRYIEDPPRLWHSIRQSWLTPNENFASLTLYVSLSYMRKRVKQCFLSKKPAEVSATIRKMLFLISQMWRGPTCISCLKLRYPMPEKIVSILMRYWFSPALMSQAQKWIEVSLRGFHQHTIEESLPLVVWYSNVHSLSLDQQTAVGLLMASFWKGQQQQVSLYLWSPNLPFSSTQSSLLKGNVSRLDWSASSNIN